jgi:hypothetical protein
MASKGDQNQEKYQLGGAQSVLSILNNPKIQVWLSFISNFRPKAV